MKHFCKVSFGAMILVLFAVQFLFSASAFASDPTYYPSGNLETVTVPTLAKIFTFKDEDYWGKTVPQGRLFREDGTRPPYGHIEYYYFSDNPDMYSMIKHCPLGGSVNQYEYYNESFYENPLVKRTAGGNVVKVYKYFDGTTLNNYLAYYDADGTELWEVAYAASFKAIDEIEIDSDGNILATGFDFASGRMVAKYDTGGNELWRIRAPISLPIGHSVMDSEDNTYVVSYLVLQSSDFFITKYDKDGNMIWNWRYQCPVGMLFNKRLMINDNGEICVRGDWAYSGPAKDLEIRYDPSGTLLFDGLIEDYFLAEFGNGGRAKKNSFKNTETHAFIYGTDAGLIEYYGDFSPTYGAASLFYYYHSENPANASIVRIEYDNGMICDAGLWGTEMEGVIEKAAYPNGDTNWFLWGADVYEGHDNVVIALEAGVYNAYGFTPNYENPEAILDKAGWTTIGPVADPGSLDLPGFGDWWEWVIKNSIVPEFPPVTIDLAYAGDRVIERIDHNPYTDTTYTYEWDYQGMEQVKVEMSYDYDDDGNVDLISTRIYDNGTDYDIANINTWQILSEGTKYYSDGVLKQYVTSLNLCDSNLNGRMDLGDFAKIRSGQGTTEGATLLTGDTNEDGAVDSEDYDNFMGQFGNRTLIRGVDTVLTGANDIPVVKIFADGHREIYIYADGPFTEDDLDASGILKPGDVVVDRTVPAAPEAEDPRSAPEAQTSEVSAIQADPDASAVFEARQAAQGAAGKRRRSKLKFLNDLKGKKTKYLDWAKD